MTGTRRCKRRTKTRGATSYQGAFGTSESNQRCRRRGHHRPRRRQKRTANKFSRGGARTSAVRHTSVKSVRGEGSNFQECSTHTWGCHIWLGYRRDVMEMLGRSVYLILNFERKIRVLYCRMNICTLIKVTCKKNIINLLQKYLDGHTFQKIFLFSTVSPLI